MITYAPGAKTNQDSSGVLFTQSNAMTLEKAVQQFSIWEDHYGYTIKEAWVDVVDDGKVIDRQYFKKAWLPTAAK